MANDIYDAMIQHRGAEYRSSQIRAVSHYREPIDHSPGRLAGNSRVWGDASPEVQSRVIDALVDSSRRAGLTPRETAHVLAIARVESGFNPDAAAGTTSASGLGQFIDRTGAHYRLNNQNRFDPNAQADALVAHFIDNRNLARSRGQGEEYIYKYHHDGPTRDYGGLGLANREVVPRLDEYERFVRQRLTQTQTTADPQRDQTTPGTQRQQTTPTPTPQAQTDTQRTTFQQTMERMLPPQNGVHAHVTGHFGEHRGARPGVAAHGHGGTDFNYNGGQAGVNLTHPSVRSPVSGTVEIPPNSPFGTVGIRDAQGNLHQVLHLNSQSVRNGQQIQAGDEIGTMGGRGPTGPGQYAQHVHYQIHDRNGRAVDPERFWNNRTVDAPTRPQEGGRTNGTTTANGNGAIADGVLRHGERGDDVRGLQQSLNRLGVRDANGQPLREDGNFGDRTREAVSAYQRQNGLKVDGIAGNETLTSIGNKLPPGQVTAQARVEGPLSVASPNHPDHALYAAIREKLPATVPDNVAANVTLQAKQSGIDAASKLRDVAVVDNNALVTGTTPGFRAKVDLAAPAPPIEETSARLQTTNKPQTVTDLQPQVAMGGR